jgi:hypothetical protein
LALDDGLANLHGLVCSLDEHALLASCAKLNMRGKSTGLTRGEKNKLRGQGCSF